MKSEKEIKEEIKSLEKLELDFAGELISGMAGIAKRRLLWVLRD